MLCKLHYTPPSQRELGPPVATLAAPATLATHATLATRVGNQWMLPYPWRKDPNFLSNKKSLALKHLVLTER